jgi:hypothetical protein
VNYVPLCRWGGIPAVADKHTSASDNSDFQH